jgi:hypothetical protein
MGAANISGVGRTITMTGSGAGTPTWSGTGAVRCNLTFNAPGKSITISGGVGFNTSILTYVAGTIITTGSTITSNNGSTTFNLGTVHLNNLTLAITPSPTYTLGSNLILDGTLIMNCNGDTIIAGAYDISCANFYGNSTTANGTLKLLHGRTLTITNSIILSGSGPFIYTIQSDSAASTYLNYTGTAANCKVFNTNFTWVDASGSSQEIWNWFGGTLSNTVNIANKTNTDIGGGGSSDVFGFIG